MLKQPIPMKQLESLGAEAIKSLLAEVPVVTLKSVDFEDRREKRPVDLVVSLDVAGDPHMIICEAKRNGQPRFVREAIHQLRDYLRELEKPATPVVIAPYLSPESRKLCLENGVS